MNNDGLLYPKVLPRSNRFLRVLKKAVFNKNIWVYVVELHRSPTTYTQIPKQDRCFRHPLFIGFVSKGFLFPKQPVGAGLRPTPTPYTGVYLCGEVLFRQPLF